MRFLAELSGNEFSYGDDFVSKTNDYDLVFANYDTEYITRMGGSYELNSVIPAHGNRFAITSAKYTEPFSDEFEIVNLNGVIPENNVGEICEKLFMNGTSYKKLYYRGNGSLVEFNLKLVINNSFTVTDSGINFVTIMRTPDNMTIKETKNFIIDGQDEVHLEINTDRNISVVINEGVTGTVEIGNTIITVSGTYEINNSLNIIKNYNELEKYNWGAYSDNMSIASESFFSSFSSPYLNCIFTDPEAIEGGVNGQWGTIGFKFTLTADSQFCWEDKHGFTISSNSSHTFYSGDVATIIPPKITITLNEVSTLYNNNKNSISFEINNVPINIDIPDNGTDDHSIVVASAPLKFIIDPKLRQVYGEYIDSGKVKIILGYPENRTDQKITYISLASVFTGFKTIPKGRVIIDDLSGNIQSIQFGDYNVGYLI